MQLPYRTIALWSVTFVFGAAVVFIGRATQAWVKHHDQFVPTHVTITTQPPREALIGTLALTVGNVQKYARASTQSASVSQGNQVLQGEELQNDETGQASVVYPNLMLITADKNADISFENTLPDTFVINQMAGDATYEVTPNHALTVRSLHAVVEISSGSAQLSVKDKQLTLLSQTALLKTAYVNHNNDTVIQTLSSRSAARYDDATRNWSVLASPSLQ